MSSRHDTIRSLNPALGIPPNLAMKRALSLFLLPAFLLSGSLSFAQQDRGGRVNRPRVSLAAEPAATQLLSQNHRFTVEARLGDKLIGKLSALTSSTRLHLMGSLGPRDDDPELSLDATIEEDEGDRLLLVYQLTMHPADAPSGRRAPGRASTSVGASGTLRMKPGIAYKVMEAGGITFVVSAKAEPAGEE